MATGKLQIISAILKLDRPFRPPHIIDMTGLDRNLVRYHLVQLTSDGFLEKIDKTYVVRDQEGLLRSMLHEVDAGETTKMKAKGFFSPDTANKFNYQAEVIIAARALDIQGTDLVKTGLLHKIDESIAELKNLRKYLCNGSKTTRSAAKFWNGMNGEELEVAWQSMVYNGGELFTSTLEDFKREIKIAVEEAQEN